MPHTFHELIAEIVAGAKFPSCEVLLGSDCGGKQKLPLYTTPIPSDEAKHTEADMLVLRTVGPRGSKVRVIIEIEESGFTPVKVFGKFAASATASYFIPRSGEPPVEFDDPTVFVQVLDTASMKAEETAKFRQFDALTSTIDSLLPLTGSRVAQYKLFYGAEADFRGKLGENLVDYLQHAVGGDLHASGWITVEAPPVPDILRRGIPVPIARAGERWSESSLGRYAKLKGVYVIHHAGRIEYVGMTERNAMYFGMRLRREFTESGSGRRHIYPKLEALEVPPEIMVSFFPPDEVRDLVTPIGTAPTDTHLIAVLEAAWIGAYQPEFQTSNGGA